MLPDHHSLLAATPLLLSAFPTGLLSLSVLSGACSVSLFWASTTNAHANSYAIDGAMITGIGSLVGLFLTAYTTWRNQGITLTKIQSEAHDREQERKYRADKEELDRKERMHDMAGRLNVLTLKLEEKQIELDRTKDDLTILRRQVEAHDARLCAASVASGENHAAIAENTAAIGEMQRMTDSGQFRAVKVDDHGRDRKGDTP